MAYSANKEKLMAKRFRPRFTFWLDMHKADEAALAEVIDILKRERTFASTIRDGIRLIYDLRAGRADILFELFPWVKEMVQPSATTSVDAHLQAQIARLEALLIAQGNVPIQRAQAERTSSGSLLEVKATSEKSSTKAVAKNFVDSMRGFASGFFD